MQPVADQQSMSARPTAVPAGSPSTVIDSSLVACAPVESVTATVKFVVPPAVGAPLIAPVAGSSVRPAGRAPVETDRVNGPAPPITFSVALNGSSCMTVGIDDALTTMPGG